MVNASASQAVEPHAPPVWIYALCEHDRTVRYVGRTRRPSARLSQHTKRDFKHNKGKVRWIVGPRDQGALPLMILLDRVPAAFAAKAEGRWMTRLGVRFPLLNRQHAGRSRGPIARKSLPLDHVDQGLALDAVLRDADASGLTLIVDGYRPKAQVRAVLIVCLKYALHVTGTSAEEFAENIGKSYATVGHWLSGKHRMHVEEIACDPAVWPHFMRCLGELEYRAGTIQMIVLVVRHVALGVIASVGAVVAIGVYVAEKIYEGITKEDG
jgi:hypothetical protein